MSNERGVAGLERAFVLSFVEKEWKISPEYCYIDIVYRNVKRKKRDTKRSSLM